MKEQTPPVSAVKLSDEEKRQQHIARLIELIKRRVKEPSSTTERLADREASEIYELINLINS